MEILDDTERIRALDSQDQFGMVAALGEQLVGAYRAGSGVIEDGGGEVGGIAVTGMGGSAIGGDIVAAALGPYLASPMITVRGYRLPGWVSGRSLVFAVSYSGNTEETVAGLNEALERGCRVVCVSTGGDVGRIAAARELPLVEVPADLQPRAAMGYLSIPLAACLESMGLVADIERDVGEAAAVLRELARLYGPDNPAAGNPAKQLAVWLKDSIPVIYGCELTAVAANRWKCQINENAKALAYYNEFPELNHNEIVGWENPPPLLDSFRVIYLEDGQSHPQNLRRMEITAGLLKDYAGEVHAHQSRGDSRLARLFSSIYLGDFVSLYLAVLYGVDPSPVARIEDLKRRLA